MVEQGQQGGLAVNDGVACDLRLRGRLDARSLPEARTGLHRAVDEAAGREVVVDLAGAEIWDAGALGVLAGAQRRAARDGRQVVLTGASARTRRMLRAARLSRLLVLRDHDEVG